MKELLALIAGLAILGFAYCHIRPQVMEQDKPYLWSPFIDNWDKIVELFESEKNLGGMGKTFDYIQELERQSRILAGWKEVKPNQWTFKKED